MEKENKKQTKFFDLFKWTITKEELKNQVENYNTLGFFRSARKVATALMLFSAIVTLIFVLFGRIHILGWGDVVSILILAFFVYKGGYKWPIIIVMLYWTLSRGLQIYTSIISFDFLNIIIPFVFWEFFMGIFWSAYQVERERNKSLKVRSKFDL